MVTLQSLVSSSIYFNIARAQAQRNASVLNLSSGRKSDLSVADFSVGSILSSNANVLRTAVENAGQGKGLFNTAKGGIDTIIDEINALKSLATQAASGTLSNSERANLNLDFQTRLATIDKLATTTSFNGKILLNGSQTNSAPVTTKTGQTTENYTLLNVSDFTLSGTTTAGDLATTSNFAAVASSDIGKTNGTTTLTLNSGGAVAGAVLTIGASTVTFSGADSDTAAADLVAQARASTDADFRKFTFSNVGSIITITAADAGDAATNDANTASIQVTTDGGLSQADLGTSTNVLSGGAASSINAAAGSTVGTNRAPTSDTFDATLLGGITNFDSSITTTGTQNTVTFTAEVNGTTYTSNAVTLFGTSGYNSKGDTIKAGQVITFSNSNGPLDAASELTDNGFTLTVGASDVTASGGTDILFAASLDTIATGFGTQLSANAINQKRDAVLGVVNSSASNFEISDADGGVFDGLLGFDSVGTNARGDVQLIGDNFGADGSLGRIGPFSFNSSTNILSVTINDVLYKADLSDNSAGGGDNGGFDTAAGGGAAYDTGTQALTFGNGVLIFKSSASTTDGKELQIDLSNVTTTSANFSTTAGAKSVTDALDTLFNVDEYSDLSFQVGTSSTNTVVGSIGSATAASLFLNDSGVSSSLDISTLSGATAAGSIITNGLNNALSLQAGISATISQFDSVIASNETTIINLDDAANNLLNTNYAEESSRLAESTLRVNIGLATLAQLQQQTSNILQLLTN